MQSDNHQLYELHQLQYSKSPDITIRSMTATNCMNSISYNTVNLQMLKYAV